MQDKDAAVGTPAAATAHDSRPDGTDGQVAEGQAGAGEAVVQGGVAAGATAAQGQAGPATATATATVGAGANGAAETGADNQTGNGQSGIVRAATATVANKAVALEGSGAVAGQTGGRALLDGTTPRIPTAITPATPPYEPTAAGRKLHAAMSNPELYGVSVTQLCESAGISRDQYYLLMRDPQYANWLKSERQAAIQRHIDRVIDAGVKTAVTPGRDGYKDRELLLQMSGQFVPRNKHEVSGKLDLRPVLPAQQVDSQLQDLGLIDVETVADEPAEQ